MKKNYIEKTSLTIREKEPLDLVLKSLLLERIQEAKECREENQNRFFFFSWFGNKQSNGLRNLVSLEKTLIQNKDNNVFVTLAEYFNQPAIPVDNKIFDVLSGFFVCHPNLIKNLGKDTAEKLGLVPELAFESSEILGLTLSLVEYISHKDSDIHYPVSQTVSALIPLLNMKDRIVLLQKLYPIFLQDDFHIGIILRENASFFPKGYMIDIAKKIGDKFYATVNQGKDRQALRMMFCIHQIASFELPETLTFVTNACLLGLHHKNSEISKQALYMLGKIKKFSVWPERNPDYSEQEMQNLVSKHIAFYLKWFDSEHSRNGIRCLMELLRPQDCGAILDTLITNLKGKADAECQWENTSRLLITLKYFLNEEQVQIFAGYLIKKANSHRSFGQYSIILSMKMLAFMTADPPENDTGWERNQTDIIRLFLYKMKDPVPEIRGAACLALINIIPRISNTHGYPHWQIEIERAIFSMLNDVDKSLRMDVASSYSKIPDIFLRLSSTERRSVINQLLNENLFYDNQYTVERYINGLHILINILDPNEQKEIFENIAAITYHVINIAYPEDRKNANVFYRDKHIRLLGLLSLFFNNIPALCTQKVVASLLTGLETDEDLLINCTSIDALNKVFQSVLPSDNHEIIFEALLNVMKTTHWEKMQPRIATALRSLISGVSEKQKQYFLYGRLYQELLQMEIMENREHLPELKKTILLFIKATLLLAGNDWLELIRYQTNLIKWSPVEINNDIASLISEYTGQRKLSF